MQILIIDKDKELYDLSGLLDGMDEHSIKYCEDYNNSQDVYNNDTYDIVFINFSVDYFKNIFKHINEKSPKQRVIIYGEALKCEKQNHSQQNQLKPIFRAKLKNYVKSFNASICIYADKPHDSYGLFEITDNVVTRYRSVACFQATKTLSINNMNNLIAISELLN